MTPTNEAGHGLPELPEPYTTHYVTDLSGTSAVETLKVYTANQMRQYARDALALSRGVPADMVLVPRVPTDAMALAALKLSLSGDKSINGVSVWHAMVEAAPAAAGAQGEVHGAVPQREEAKSTFVPCDCGCGRSCCAFCGNDVGFVTKAPQPAAADGGVRERAREIVSAVVSQEFRLTSKEAKQWWRYTGINAHESDALMIRCVEAALSSHRQAGEPNDVEKSVSVLRVLHQGSADDMAKAGREDLANVHYDAIRLLDYALDLHRQNVSMPNSENSEYKPWAKAIDELAWVIGELEYIEGVKAIKSSEIPDYISRKAAWRESCEALVKEHGRALLAPPPGADLSKFRELAERWRTSASVCGETEYSDGARDAFSECAAAVLALVEKGAGNGILG